MIIPPSKLILKLYKESILQNFRSVVVWLKSENKGLIRRSMETEKEETHMQSDKMTGEVEKSNELGTISYCMCRLHI